MSVGKKDEDEDERAADLPAFSSERKCPESWSRDDSGAWPDAAATAAAMAAAAAVVLLMLPDANAARAAAVVAADTVAETDSDPGASDAAAPDPTADAVAPDVAAAEASATLPPAPGACREDPDEPEASSFTWKAVRGRLLYAYSSCIRGIRSGLSIKEEEPVEADGVRSAPSWTSVSEDSMATMSCGMMEAGSHAASPHATSPCHGSITDARSRASAGAPGHASASRTSDRVSVDASREL